MNLVFFALLLQPIESSLIPTSVVEKGKNIELTYKLPPSDITNIEFPKQPINVIALFGNKPSSSIIENYQNNTITNLYNKEITLIATFKNKKADWKNFELITIQKVIAATTKRNNIFIAEAMQVKGVQGVFVEQVGYKIDFLPKFLYENGKITKQGIMSQNAVQKIANTYGLGPIFFFQGSNE